MTRLARSEVLDPNEVAVAENWGQSTFSGVEFVTGGGDDDSWVGLAALFSQEVE